MPIALPLLILTTTLAWPLSVALAQGAPDGVDFSRNSATGISRAADDGEAAPRTADPQRARAAAMGTADRARWSVDRRLWRNGAMASFGYHHVDDPGSWGPPATGLAAQSRFAAPRSSVGARVNFEFR